MFYQAAVTLQSFAVTVHLLALFEWRTAAAITRVTPNDLRSASSVLAIILAFLLLLDPLLTPVPFRLAYIIPCAVFVSVWAAFTVYISADRQLAPLSIVTSFAISFSLGVIITLYARIIYVTLHRHRILYALNPHLHGSAPHSDVTRRPSQP